MNETKRQDTQTKLEDAAAGKLGLNKETVRDLDVPNSEDVLGGFLMKDTIIIRTSR